MSGSPTTDHGTTPPVTPPPEPPGLRLPSIAAAANGTPHNRGSASRSHRDDANDKKGSPPRITKDYDEYLLEDLTKHRVYISFEHGLQNILHVPSDWKSSGHEYQRIISEVRRDVDYLRFRDAYLEICDKVGAIEPTLYKPQAELYNRAIALINKFCDERYRKDEGLLLHFRVNHPKPITQGIFHPLGLNPDITGIFKLLEKRKSFVWPMIVHVEEMKDSDAALDTGSDAPRARIKGGKDPVSEHHYPSRKTGRRTKDADAQDTQTGTKRKNVSDVSTANKVSRTSQRPSPSASQNSEFTTTPKDNQKTTGARLQCARYLMEMLELSILQSHAFLTLVDRDNLQLMYADRSAIVTTSIIDLRTHDGEAMFLAMLIAFHRLTPKQWGFLSLVENSFASQPSGPTAYHCNEAIVEKHECLRDLKLSLNGRDDGDDKDDLCLMLGDIIYHQPGIIGRGTCVVEATPEDIERRKETRDLVVKVSWPSKSRPSEIALLERARKKGEELVKMRKAERAQLESDAEKLQGIGKTAEAAKNLKIAETMVEESGKHWALNHLPNILHSQDFNFDSEAEPMPQKTLALFFKNAEIINGTFYYEDRTLRFSVQEKLYKIITLSSLPSYAQAFYDVLQCHRWLHEHPRILHRDISPGNIMCRVLDDKVYGVLNDLDLSSLREDVETGNRTSFQRTGTPPYMAIELLQDAHNGTTQIRHLYRHDLESLAYIVLVFCSRNEFNPEDGSIKRLPKSPFDDWFDPDLSWDSLGNKKQAYLLRPLQLAADVHQTFNAFVPWLEILLNMFQQGFSTRAKWRADMDTYNLRLRRTQSVEVGESDADDIMFNNMHNTEGPVTAGSGEPLPFDEHTLGGHINYDRLVRSLRMFSGEKLLYRNKDKHTT